MYLSAGFIIEEGLDIAILEKIVASMASEARRQSVSIITGDTKVVPAGKADKIFINTTGIGRVRQRCEARLIRPADKILINGPVAEHGLSVLVAREKFTFRGRLESDCNSLWPLVKLLLKKLPRVHFMRDPTRGGVNAVCHEVVALAGYSLLLREERIPVTATCRALTEILGLDLLDIANEGKMIFFVGPDDADKALRILRSHPLGRGASIIGEVLREKKEKVYLETVVGGRKMLGPLMTEPIPRIC
jgi:hydrogenase expression/formation protein HypE